MGRLAGAMAIVIMVTSNACSGTQATPSPRPTPPPTASVIATQAPTQAPSPVATPMPLNVGCSDADPCVLSAGTWVLTGRFSFILGLEITVPDGLQSLEQDAGEFNLFSIDRPAEHFLAARDIVAVASDGTMTVAQGVPPTVDGITAYWRADPNLVVGPAEPTTIAGGIDAVTYMVTISPDAQFTDRGCPAYPLCADLFTDPQHWEGVYGIGAPAAVRLYFATIGTGNQKHMLVLGLEAGSESDLSRLTSEFEPVIDSIRIPDPIVVF